MPILRATVTLNNVNGEESDASVNVWHFEHAGPVAVAAPVISDHLWQFYDSISSGFSPQIARATNSHKITVATLTPGAAGAGDDVVSRVVHEELSASTFTASAVSSALPPEIAMCLSFMGDIAGLNEELGTTRPISRRRGRVYLGPWNTSVISPTGPPVFEASIVDSWVIQYQSMVNGIRDQTIDDSIHHVIYSPTTGQAHVVETAWIDNAPDIMRSRGVRSSYRKTLSINQTD